MPFLVQSAISDAINVNMVLKMRMEFPLRRPPLSTATSVFDELVLFALAVVTNMANASNIALWKVSTMALRAQLVLRCMSLIFAGQS